MTRKFANYIPPCMIYSWNILITPSHGSETEEDEMNPELLLFLPDINHSTP